MCMSAILKADDTQRYRIMHKVFTVTSIALTLQKERLPIEEECNTNHCKGGDIEINYNNF